MTHRISVALSDYQFDSIFQGVNCCRSARIAELTWRGLLQELAELEGSINYQALALKQQRIIKDLEDEVRRLKLKVGSLKSKLGKDKNFKHDRVWKEMEAIRRRGLG